MKACTISNALGAVGNESKVAVAVMHLLSLLYKPTTTIPLQFMREASLWELMKSLVALPPETWDLFKKAAPRTNDAIKLQLSGDVGVLKQRMRNAITAATDFL